MSGVLVLHTTTKSAPANIVLPGTPIRPLLSANGQAAYDAAVVNGWFSVSNADFQAVRNNHPNTIQRGLEGTISSTVIYLYRQCVRPRANVSFVTAGEYVVGFKVQNRTGAGVVPSHFIRTYYTSNISSIASYSIMGAGPANIHGDPGEVYFLRKGPTIQAANGFVCVGQRYGPGINAFAQGVARQGISAPGNRFFGSNTVTDEWPYDGNLSSSYPTYQDFLFTTTQPG